MGVYSDIVGTCLKEDWEVKYNLLEELSPAPLHALSLQKNWNPISIKEREWCFIRTFVAKAKLSHGYELATGVGLSSIAAGLGMKANLAEFKSAPRMVTMDAFIEENRHSSLSYVYDAPECYEDADGYKSVQKLIQHHGLEGIVFPTVGWSPTDTTRCLSSVFDLEKEKLDYVFIDGMHYWASVKADIDSILPYLNRERYALFLHDTHAPELGAILDEYVRAHLGIGFTTCPGCSVAEGCFNLAIVTNIEVDLATILAPGE